jgi:nitroimidazol reductase NimA-like FMN-containing flavoprotein (pyridoxamine 5'-phosphate oxidase superfamily)
MAGWIKRSGAYVEWQEVDGRLRSARSAWLASTRPDGRPHAAPVWFVWNGHEVHYRTSRRSRKGLNLVRQPWTVFHLGDGEDVLIAEGESVEVSDIDQLAEIRQRYGDKYVEPVTGERASLGGFEDDVVYRLAPQRILVWSYGNIASRTVWVRNA